MFTIIVLGILMHLLMLRILCGKFEFGGFHFSNSLRNNYGKGGGTTVVNSTPPPQPTTGQSIQEWIASQPDIWAAQEKYAPLEAQQQVDLMTKYAAPLGLAYRQAQDAINPMTSQLQETMAGQALEGMNATQMPEWMRRNYQSDFNANLGTNAGSPIGADYVSRGMQKQLFDQQKSYRDLGLSLAGRQPLSTPGQPSATNYMSTFTPASVMGSVNQNYGTFASASRPLGYRQNGGGGLFGSLFG